MYKSPIKLIRADTLFSSTRSIEEEIAEKMAKPIAIEIDNYILESVRRVDVSVDREELLKALAYDRQQYNKGFQDGVRDVIEKLKEKSTYHLYAYGMSYTDDFLDSIKKEMVGEG
jgi:hypothetical protein